MTHTAPMPDSAGKFSDAKPAPEYGCRHCGVKGTMVVEKWESNCGGYEDYKYTCTVCKHGFWIEGPDS